MASTQAVVVLRHIRGLVASGENADESDGQLLERFTRLREESAFHALVRRHGPLVMGVCRRVLRNREDTDDAFQATFLVLARKAAAIGKRASLGSWLYKVAYHMAVRARKQSATRQKRESQAPAPTASDPLAEVTGRELPTLLDEELQNLPDRYRAPLVHCYLEGQTRDEAAKQLGCSESTVNRRLEEGKKQLHKRLFRRGVDLSAALIALALTQNVTKAALSKTFIGATVKACLAAAVRGAMGSLVSPRVAELANGALRAMNATKLKIATCLLLATSLVVASTGALAQTLAHQADVVAASAAQDQDRPARASEKQSLVALADAKEGDRKTVRGLVLDADEKPAAGADVALLGEPKSNSPDNVGFSQKPLAHGRADGDGRFSLSVARAALADYRAVYTFAGKAGHGLAWAKADLQMPSHETRVRLASEKVIRGRLIDVQGQPAVGVRVSVSMLHGPAWKDGGATAFVSPPEGFKAWPGPATTDKDGKFTIAGLSPDLGGTLAVDGEEFTPTHAAIKAGKENRNQEFNLTLSPARILEGVVTAADTGKPVPKASIVCLDDGAPAYGQTDEKGRYRVRLAGGGQPGLPTGVTAVPPEGQPYLPREAPLEWPKGAVKRRINLVLPRGVVVRGIVTDAATGKPVAGAKAMAVVIGRFLWSPNTPRLITKDDGAFALVVPTGGRGHVLVKGPNNDYVTTEITGGELLGGKRNGDRNYADAIIPFESKPGMDALDVTAKLRRGVTIRGLLFGPGDKPVAGALMACWNRVDLSAQWQGYPIFSVPVSDGTFELRGCDPEMTYAVYFLDARNKLGATARLSAKEAAGKEVTVRLEPCASAIVRFVDKAANPLKGHRANLSLVLRPGDEGVGADTIWLVNFDQVNYKALNSVADAEGRCTFPVLIPGATYSGSWGNKPNELTVKPGETLKFEVVIEKPQ